MLEKLLTKMVFAIDDMQREITAPTRERRMRRRFQTGKLTQKDWAVLYERSHPKRP